VVVAPTGAGKTYLAQLAMQATRRSTLICGANVDSCTQWYAHLLARLPDAPVGSGGGSMTTRRCWWPRTIARAIYAEALGNKYALVVFDECHHLPRRVYPRALPNIL